MRRTLLALGLLAAAIAPAAAQTIPFANNDRSCREYGVWAVQTIQRAAQQGCNVLANGERLDAGFHENWCKGQSLASMMKAHLIHRTGVAFRCAKQGVDVR